MSQSIDLAHLHESRRDLALRDANTRKAAILSDRWVGYQKASDALMKMEDLLVPTQIARKKSLLLLSENNNGKTTLLRRFEKLHPGESINNEPITVPILRIDMPSAPDVSNLYSYILDAAFAPHNPTAPRLAKESQVRRVLTALGVRVLVIDEFSNVLLAGPRTMQSVLGELKNLSNRQGLSILAAGVRSASSAIIGNTHLFSRFDCIELPLWKNDEEFHRLLASMERLLPLRKPSNLKGRSISDYMFPACGGVIGAVSEFLNTAAIVAIDSGTERITPDIMKQVVHAKATVKQAFLA